MSFYEMNFEISINTDKIKKMIDIQKKYKLQLITIKKEAHLYRFIDKAPNAIKKGMSHNKGKDGRFNNYQNVYYCSKSIDGVLQEVGEHKSGSLIVSEVVEDLHLGFVTNNELSLQLRGRTSDQPMEFVHSEILKPLEMDKIITYKETSKYFEEITQVFADGIIYPSVHSLDVIIGDTKFQVTDDIGFSNIALTESGYKKIKEWYPIVYWH